MDTDAHTHADPHAHGQCDGHGHERDHGHGDADGDGRCRSGTDPAGSRHSDPLARHAGRDTDEKEE